MSEKDQEPNIFPEEPIDFSEIQKASEILQKLMGQDESSSQEVQAQGMQDIAEFDKQLQTPSMNMVKAMIPFMETSHQRTLGVLIKLAEIQQINQLYASPRSAEHKPVDKRKLLLALKPHCNAHQQKMIDLFIKLMDTQNIMELLNR